MKRFSSRLPTDNYTKGISAILFVGFFFRLMLWDWGRANWLDLLIYRLPDDAFYYFTIARQMALGHGITIDGVHATNGMHPLWLFLISPFFAALSKIDAVQAVVAFQSLLDVLLIWLIADGVRRALPRASESNRTSAALAAAALYAASPLVLVRSVNGLETTVTAIMILLWLRVAARLLSHRDAFATWLLLGVTTGTLLLARTDMFLLILPASCWMAWRRRREWKAMFAALLVAVVIVMPWLAWNYATFGTIFQSSAEAVPFFAMLKYRAIYGPGGTYPHLLVDAARTLLKPWFLVTFGASLITGVCAIRKWRGLASRVRVYYFAVLGSMLLLAVHILFRGFTREWYLLQLVPLYLTFFGVTMGVNAGATEARWAGRWTLVALLLLVALLRVQQPAYLSQAALVAYGAPIEHALGSPRYPIASLNSGYYSYMAEDPRSVVNMDGVVNEAALHAIQHHALGSYLLRDSVAYVLEFRGDLGGYRNLIDRNLLQGFALDTSFVVFDSTNPLELYSRPWAPSLPRSSGEQP